LAGRGLIVPSSNSAEAALAGGQNHLCAESLLAVVAWLHGRDSLEPAATAEQEPPGTTKDLSDVYGQLQARRALEIAAAGGHNILFSGPPGTGKTMLASRLPGILPPMSEQEALDTAVVASVSQVGLDTRYWKVRSFRSPHHTASAAALVGGGSRPRPGEISLAHHGVLFLDELPEFNRNVLEVLREPMETGRIIISRAANFAEFPARFQLVAAMNPCPCGYAGDTSGRCQCSLDQVRRYRGKISGPLLDRIDLHVEVSRTRITPYRDSSPQPEGSRAVRQRVIAARKIQLRRAGAPNALLGHAAVRQHCKLGPQLQDFLEAVMDNMGLSPRGCQRIVKVARTLADLESKNRIGRRQLAEAMFYRGIDCEKNQG
jgi:magnesium chelatase family protein